MKIEAMKPVYLEDYDINVKRYLDYAEVQNIANEAIQHQSWSEREQIIDYMLLVYATDINKQEIDTLEHDVFAQSGMMDKIKSCILNYSNIEEAIKFEESWFKQIGMIYKSLPEIVKENLKK